MLKLFLSGQCSFAKLILNDLTATLNIYLNEIQIESFRDMLGLGLDVFLVFLGMVWKWNVSLRIPPQSLVGPQDVPIFLRNIIFWVLKTINKFWFFFILKKKLEIKIEVQMNCLMITPQGLKFEPR